MAATPELLIESVDLIDGSGTAACNSRAMSGIIDSTFRCTWLNEATTRGPVLHFVRRSTCRSVDAKR